MSGAAKSEHDEPQSRSDTEGDDHRAPNGSDAASDTEREVNKPSEEDEKQNQSSEEEDADVSEEEEEEANESGDEDGEDSEESNDDGDSSESGGSESSDGNELFEYAEEGDVDNLSKLLDTGIDINEVDEDGWSALHFAVCYGKEEVVRLLLARGIDTTLVENDGYNALHYSVYHNQPACAKILIEAGVDLDAYIGMDMSDGSRLEDGENALHMAIARDQKEIVELMLDHGANTKSQTYHGDTLLGVAVATANLEIAEMLLQRGMDINEVPESGETPLHDAVQSGLASSIEFVLSKGGKIDVQDEAGRTPLHECFKADVVAVFLKYGADVNAVDNMGRTVLHHAARLVDVEGSIELVEFLLNNGADMAIRDKNGRTPLNMAIAKNNGDAIRLLLSHADATGKETMCSSEIVLLAAKRGYEDLISFHVNSSDLSVTDRNGSTALHLAAYEGHELIVEMLLLHGSDVHAVDAQGRTPLHRACANGGAAIGAKLLDFKADVKAVDSEGNTPLHITAACRQANSMRLMLDRGADPSALNWDGHSPLMVLIHTAFDGLYADHVHLARLLCAQRATNDADEFEASSYELTESQLGLVEAIEHWEDCLLRADPLTEIPPEVVFNGKASVQSYIASLRDSLAQQVVYRRKICVVGPSTWGKTSLVKSVSNNFSRMVSIEDRTVGIDLFPFAFSTGENSKRHDVTFWDFAGQDIYHVAHSLFFSERTLFLVCVDLYTYARAVRDIEREFDAASLAAENATRRYLEEHVIHWIRKILLRQPEAEFVVVGTKKDLLKDDERVDAAVNNLQLRLSSLAVDLAKEVQLKDETRERLQASLSVCYPTGVRFVTDVQASRATIERAVTQHPELSFPMPLMYMRVLEELKTMKLKASMATTPDERVDLAIQPIALLCNTLVRTIDGLEPAQCHEILHVLDRLGDVLWYQNERGVFMDEIILDPGILLDVVREVVNHNYENKEGEDYQCLQRDGTLKHALLMTLPLWKALAGVDSEMVHMFKYLLQQFGLAYPAGNTEMHPEVDLIVPAYWTPERAKAASHATTTAISTTSSHKPKVGSHTACWEYKIPIFVAKVVYEHFVVESYCPNVRRTTTADGFTVSRVGEFHATVSYRAGPAKSDALRITVTAADDTLVWHELRFFVMAMEEMLSRNYPALRGIQRHIIVPETGASRSLSDAVKALNDAAAIGRDEAFVRARMPWVPPSFSWYIEQAWLDPGKLHEIRTREAFGQIQQKLAVLQRLVVSGDKRRHVPALWLVAYAKDKRSVQVRFLSDVSGMCYHLPIEIEASRLGDSGQWLQVGVSVFSTVAAEFLSVDLVANAIAIATESMDSKLGQSALVHNCIDGLSLTPGTFDQSTAMAVSAGGARARLRELMTLVDPEFDELKVGELSNLQCAATVNEGAYVWAHRNEIEAMQDQLLPCDPVQQCGDDGATPSAVEGGGRINLAVSSATGLRVKDWFKTYCDLQLVDVDTGRVVASHRTVENADAHVEPVWAEDPGVAVKGVSSLEDLRRYKLVVRVRRPSRMEQLTWFRCERKLIAQAEVALAELLPSGQELGEEKLMPFQFPVGADAEKPVCTIHGGVSVQLCAVAA